MQPQLERSRAISQTVQVPAHPVMLAGDLVIPSGATGIVLFAHGSGSSRLSPRNRRVAATLRANASVGTLLIDLLSREEELVDERTHELRFDIDLLARRLQHAIQWLESSPTTRRLELGLFGASTGAAAALVAAAARPDVVDAVVSRGGRPDLAGDALTVVQAPTLLVVGGFDDVVVDLNRAAQRIMAGTSRLAIVPGATHLFEEVGALDEVATLASDWFSRYLR